MKSRHSFRKKPASTRYLMAKRGGTSLHQIHWVKIFMTVAILAVVVIGIILLVRTLSGGKPTMASLAPSPAIDTQGAFASSTPTAMVVQDGSSEENALDLSQEAILVSSSERNINLPSISGDEMVYSAGTGALDKPVFKKLYYFDLKTMQEELLSEVTVKDGEIYETRITDRYIVWVDTDQRGNNRLFFKRRFVDDTIKPNQNIDPDTGEVIEETASSSQAVASKTSEPAEDPLATKLIKECDFHMPVLRISGDILIWTEQNGDKEEELYMVDLISEENVALPMYTDSILGFEEVYSVSAPDIYANEAVWAAPDRLDATGTNSVIYSCKIDRLHEDTYQPTYWAADMYVHDPITNGKALAWIDRNHEPIQNLYIKYGETVTKVASATVGDELTSYCFGDGMLVYAKGGAIWVYFYETGKYGRVTAPGEKGVQPVSAGRHIVWFDKGVDKDQLKVVYIP